MLFRPATSEHNCFYLELSQTDGAAMAVAMAVAMGVAMAVAMAVAIRCLIDGIFKINNAWIAFHPDLKQEIVCIIIRV